MIQQIVVSLFVSIVFYHVVNSQMTSSSPMINQTVKYTSQVVNQTATMDIMPILISMNQITTTMTSSESLNLSNQCIAYKPLVILLLFYTIIFEKYSRR